MTKEEQKKYDKQYYVKNRERILKLHKQYRINNRNKTSEQRKQFYFNNLGHIKQYYINNKEKILKQNKQWTQDNPKKVTIIAKKRNSKRRLLGFFPLNSFFLNSEAHHISENFVIYIPKSLHQGLYHNIWTWQEMEAINKLAIEYL